MALDCQHVHPHGAGAGRHGGADVAITHDAQHPPGDHLDLERRPRRGLLAADHAPEVLGEVQNRRQREFSQRLAEDAAAVGELRGAFDQRGKEQLIQARRARVYPPDPRTHAENLRQSSAGQLPIQDRFGFRRGILESFRRSADRDRGIARQFVQHGEMRIGGIGYDDKAVHESFSYGSGTRSSTSLGEAVPVPFFMMVMEAARLPKLAAAIGSPVAFNARAAPAEKLSPAPQMSTGFAMFRERDHTVPPSPATMAPSPPAVIARKGASRNLRSSA